MNAARATRSVTISGSSYRTTSAVWTLVVFVARDDSVVPSSLGPEKFYGLRSWREWREPWPDYLKPTKTAPTRDWATNDILDVFSFRELFRVVSFLNVMNKVHVLAFRGQSADFEPLPTIFRSKWRSPNNGEFEISTDWIHYRDGLATACDRATSVLLKKGLPRHQPFRTYRREPERRVAPWAVVQHYELWPTPLLDLTTSLRVAATFALGIPTPSRSGYLYVFALEHVVSDVMEELNSDSRHAAIRLSAVCPPTTERPHLQEGLLVGDPAFGRHGEADSARSPMRDRLVAKFRLVDRGLVETSTFWDHDFPRHSQRSLLPHDEVRDELVDAMQYCVDKDRLGFGALTEGS